MTVKKCIIPIAGKGTRFLPITKVVSKEMLPIVNYPTILLQVQECLRSGIEEIIFVVGKHNYDLVNNLFTKNNELDSFLDDKKRLLLNDLNEVIDKVKFSYVYQDENIRGTAGALYAAKDLINKDEYFAVMYGDDLFSKDTLALKQLIEANKQYNCNILGVGKVPNELVSNYGIIKYKKDNIVEAIIEKPEINDAPSNDAIKGRFIIHSSFFDKVLSSEKHENNEYFLPEILLSLEKEIRSVEITGEYFDIGSHLGYIKANIMYAMDSSIKDELKEFLKSIGD